MLELTSSRHNPLIDPSLHVWSWEIPVYLFAGGIVAGMMILGGLAMLRVARGDDPNSEVSRLLASRRSHALNPAAGTEPRIWYLD